MQGLMQSYPLTLTHVFRRAERLFPEKGIATVTGGGIERTTYGEWAERTRRLAGVLDDARRSPPTAASAPSRGTRRGISSSTSRHRVAGAFCTP